METEMFVFKQLLKLATFLLDAVWLATRRNLAIKINTMADEVLMDFLHSELVNYVINSSVKKVIFFLIITFKYYPTLLHFSSASMLILD